MAQNERKCTTPMFRGSFTNVFEPQAGMNGGEPKYGLSGLFDQEAQKTAEFSNMLKLAVAAARDKWGDKLKPDGKGWFHGIRNPFRDGAEKSELEGYEAGVLFTNMTSKHKPGVVNAKRERITDPEEIYPGVYVRATVVAYAYEQQGNKGVAFGLNNLQKLKDGKNIGGFIAAENDFDEVDTSSWEAEDDFLN